MVDLNLIQCLYWEYLNPEWSYTCGLSILRPNHNSKELFLLRAEGKALQVRGGQKHPLPKVELCLSRKAAGILPDPPWPRKGACTEKGLELMLFKKEAGPSEPNVFTQLPFKSGRRPEEH